MVNIMDRATNLCEISTLQEEFFALIVKQGKSINTIKNYRTDMECFNKFLNKIQHADLFGNEGLNIVLDYGGHLKKKYDSHNSRRRRIQTLRKFYDFLIEKGIVTENHIRKIPTSPKILDIPRPTPVNEVRELWNHLADRFKDSESKIEKLTAKRNQIIFLLIFTAGLKVSDISKLKESSILHDKEGELRVLVNPLKRDPYSIPLHPLFKDIYSEYQLLLEKVKKISDKTFDYILFNANPYKILAGSISARGIEIILEDFRKKLKINLTPKSLRQSCIFNWLNKNTEDSLVKEWLGVAPSYSLKLYRNHLLDNPFNDYFIGK